MLMDELRAGLPAQRLKRVVDRPSYTTHRLAQEIISVFPEELILRTEEFPDRIQFRIGKCDGLELQRVIFGRQSLERLDRDPNRDVKIDYLRRELANAARTRRTWSYPRAMSLR